MLALQLILAGLLLNSIVHAGRIQHENDLYLHYQGLTDDNPTEECHFKIYNARSYSDKLLLISTKNIIIEGPLDPIRRSSDFFNSSDLRQLFRKDGKLERMSGKYSTRFECQYSSNCRYKTITEGKYKYKIQDTKPGLRKVSLEENLAPWHHKIEYEYPYRDIFYKTKYRRKTSIEFNFKIDNLNDGEPVDVIDFVKVNYRDKWIGHRDDPFAVKANYTCRNLKRIR